MRSFKVILMIAAIMASSGLAQQTLKKSTVVVVTLPPLYKFSDGTMYTSGIALHAAHVLIRKYGGASFGSKHSATAPSIDASGARLASLDATDTDTVGPLDVFWPDPNGVTSVARFEVIDPNSWHGVIEGQMDLYSIGGIRCATDPNGYFWAYIKGISKSAGVMSLADVQAILTTEPATTVAADTDDSTFTLTAGSAVNHYYEGNMIVVSDANDANRKACRFVRAYSGATKTIVTDQPLPFTPAAGDSVYIILNRAVGRGRVSP